MGLFSKILELIKGGKDFTEIKNNLILADIDIETINYIESELKKGKDLKIILRTLIKKSDFKLDKENKNIFLIIGVNGSGKTTLISKIANYYKNKNYKILISGADTYRAAAIDQLKHWCDKLKIDFISNIQGADPASVVFDSIDKMFSSNYNLLIIDTAGRLQNKDELNQQLIKIDKIINKKIDNLNSQDGFNKFYYHKNLVIDANLGKNSINQAEVFNKIIKIDSFSVTKLDSTAKGGAIYTICKKLSLPISYVSFGEKIELLKTFEDDDFIDFIIEKI
jgi:fused signal recognition particle receptor